MQLTVVIPHLFWPDPELPDIYRDLPLPATEQLLSRGRHLPDPAHGLLDWLARAFQLPAGGMVPLAPLSLALDGIGHEQAYWLRADPVVLQLNRDQLILADSGVLSLSQDEADALVDSLNRHFESDGLTFVAPHPTRWYVRCAQAPSMTVAAVADIVGQDIHPNLPRGDDAMTWHRYLNEAQMLFYTHPVNEAREQAGDPTVSSLWFWGGGSHAPLAASRFDTVVSDNWEATALAHAAGCDTVEMPATAGEWLSQPATTRPLLVLDSLSGPAQYGDAYGWREAITALERDWLAPLRQALAARRIAQLELVVPGQLRCIVTPAARWAFWRPTRALSSWAPASQGGNP